MTRVLERAVGAPSPDALLPALEAVRAKTSDPQRRAALERVDARGLPGRKDEAWRFTRLGTLLQGRFAAPEPRVGAALQVPQSVLDDLPGGAEATRRVFVNGRLREDLSRAGPLPEGATAGPLSAPHAQGLGHQEGLADGRSPFVDLNAALWEEGALLHLPRGARLGAPLVLLFLSAAEEGPVAVHPRVRVVLEEGAEAQVVEVHRQVQGSPDAASAPVFTNAVSEVHLGPAAALSWAQVQAPLAGGSHLGSLQVHQQRSSRFLLHAVHRGGPLVRNDVHVVLGGEGAECSLRGLALVQDGAQVDEHTWVDHARPHAHSDQLYKAVVAGRAEAVFDGTIRVREGADGAVAHQRSKNLLLSDQAVVHANPRLQILTDDVRCTHGATLGQLAGESLFYLRSRGLPEASARALLTYAFVADQLETVRDAGLREWLQGFVRQALPDFGLEGAA